MSTPSKRPSLAELTALDVRRKPLLAPKSRETPFAARYEITAAGHVYRDDGRLLLPNPKLRVNLCGGSTSKSLPVAVYAAFGTVTPSNLQRFKWTPWLPPDTPTEYYVRDGNDWLIRAEPVVGKDCRERKLCTIHTIVLVPHGELISSSNTGKPPPTQLKIV